MMFLPTIILFTILFIPVAAVAIDAITDSKNILNVKHLRGSLIYAAGVGVPYLVLWGSVDWWHFIALPILTRAALFDPFLNYLTGNPFNYNGDKTNKKRSIIDSIEDWTGLSIFWLRVFYIIIYSAYVIYFLWSYLT